MVPYYFSVVKGDTYLGAQFQVLRDGIPVDLTGVIIRACFRTSPDAPIVLEMSTVNTKIEITVPLQGRFEFKEQLIDIPANTYNYDVQFTFPDDKVTTLINGTLVVLQDYTY